MASFCAQTSRQEAGTCRTLMSLYSMTLQMIQGIYIAALKTITFFNMYLLRFMLKIGIKTFFFPDVPSHFLYAFCLSCSCVPTEFSLCVCAATISTVLAAPPAWGAPGERWCCSGRRSMSSCTSCKRTMCS